MRYKVSFLRIFILFISVIMIGACQKMAEPGSSYVEGPSEDETRDQTLRRQNEIMRHQKLELERQQKELEDLERQKYYDRAIEPYNSQ